MNRTLCISLAIAAATLTGCEEGAHPKASPGDGSGPPANAQFLEDASPIFIINTILRTSDANRDSTKALFIDSWIPEEGWDGTVESVNHQFGGTTLGFRHTTTGIIGGEYWVIVLLPRTDAVNPGDTAVFQGRIADIEIVPAGPVPTFRIIADRARLLQHLRP